ASWSATASASVGALPPTRSARTLRPLMGGQFNSRQRVKFEISIRPKRNDVLWQGRQKQHDTNTEKDDIFEQEFTGEVPRYWVRGHAPFDDTRCREEKRPCNRKGTNSHQ